MRESKAWEGASGDNFFESSCRNIPKFVSRKREPDFWRKEEPILDAEGSVAVGGMWSHQRKVWELPNFVKALVGGYGSGKTSLAAKRSIAMALENAPCPVATVSPTFGVARRTIIPAIAELLQGKQAQYGQAFRWRYNSAYHEFKITFEGRQAHIMVLSAERPDLLKGSNLAAAIIDEPFIQPDEVFKQIIARTRHPDAVSREILLVGTPEGITGWGYDLCKGELNSKMDVGIVFASTRDNKALPADYVGTLESSLSEKEAKAYIDGQFQNLSEGMIYYAFDPMEHIRELPIPDNAYLGAGMDFNVLPFAVAVFWRLGSHMHFFREYELSNADTEYACSVLIENHWQQGLRDIYPDATGKHRSTNSPGGKSDFHFIREAGFDIKCRDSNPIRKDRYNAVNSKFKPRTGPTTLTISPKCKKLIKYLSTYSHELIQKQEDMSHLCDAFGYPIAYLFPKDREALRVQSLHGH